MATAAPNPNENGPSRMRKIMSYNMNEDIRSRLPREGEYGSPSQPPPPINPPLAAEQTPQPAGSRRPWWNSGFFPVFWTVASAISLLLNVFLCLFLFGILSLRAPLTRTVTGQSTTVLGGLYSNFQALDQATIRSNIPVDASIPINIMVPVQTRTTIRLSAPVQIRSRACLIRTGGLTLDAPALVTLPEGQPLDVDLNFMLPVQSNVPVHLDVPVNIPLRDTELHGPFVGLQEVVDPGIVSSCQDQTLNTCRLVPTRHCQFPPEALFHEQQPCRNNSLQRPEDFPEGNPYRADHLFLDVVPGRLPG